MRQLSGAVRQFDPPPSGDSEGQRRPVVKTRIRKVVTLELGHFQAKETIRRDAPGAGGLNPSPLAGIVPAGQRYGADLIAWAGENHFLRGQSLTSLHAELSRNPALPPIPFTSLHRLSQKFLFYSGLLHANAAPAVREALGPSSQVCWLLDGTVEPGTPVFLGARDAATGILLNCRKIPSENRDDISAFLQETAELYGRPGFILHDLSEAMSSACGLAFPGIRHGVCHFHLLNDIGKDMFNAHNCALSGRLRASKLMSRLKEQRHGQTAALRKARASSPDRKRPGRPRETAAAEETPGPGRCGRSALLALHQWLLDYCHDGNRQGFPFDPYLLYLHRRISRALQVSSRLLGLRGSGEAAPQALANFNGLLESYIGDAQVQSELQDYEAAWSVFDRLRSVLRLESEGSAPRSSPYSLPASERRKFNQTLRDFIAACQSGHDAEIRPARRKHYQIVLDHLTKYLPLLLVDEDGPSFPRTTNELEQHWRTGKRHRRQTHGRGRLGYDFRVLPKEYMLVMNLDNPVYIGAVLGCRSQLPAKLAAASLTAPPFSRWDAENDMVNLGRLPKKQIRNSRFLDDLVSAYEKHCGNLLNSQ